MNARDHLELVRREYLDAYRAAIRASKEDGTFLGTEVSVRPRAMSGDESAPEIMTFDLVTGTDQDSKPIMLMNPPREGPILGALPAGNIEVALYPFRWESCSLWLKHPDPDWGPLHAWFNRWFEEEAGNQPDDDGLLGMVHFMSEPLAEGGGYLLEIDFGSAPIKAFDELLHVLAQMGATEVRVGTSDGSDMEPAIADALAADGLTPKRFVELVASLMRDLEGVRAVRIADDMVMEVDQEGMKEPYISNLGNLWRIVQQTPPEHRARQVQRFLRGHLESAQYGKTGENPGLGALRPVIKATPFIDHLREFALKRGDPSIAVLYRPLVGDLWEALVWDRPNGMQFVMSREIDAFGLSPDEAFARARKNYLESPRSVETSAEGSGAVVLARTHDNYDASLLVDDAFWKAMQDKMPGQLLACAPTRDAILITSTAAADGEHQIRTLAEQLVHTANHAISTTLLRRVGDAWQVHEAAPAPPPPAPPTPTASAPPPAPPQPKKKPWWRFW